MKFRDVSFPLTIGTNGDVTSSNTLESCINSQIRFIFYNEPLSIPAFPEVGAMPNIFGTPGDQYFVLDNMVYTHKIKEAIMNYVTPITNVEVKLEWSDNGVLIIHFFYTVLNGEKYTYSLNYYHPVEA